MFKKKMHLYLILVLAFCTGMSCLGYRGAKVYEVVPENSSHQEVLQSLHEIPGVDFWTCSRILRRPNIIMVKPNRELMEKFHFLMKKHKIKYSEIISDVGSLFAEKCPRYSCVRVKDETFNPEKYNSLQAIESYLKDVVATNPTKLTWIKMGKSFEGREIVCLKLSKRPHKSKPAILIDAGMHAREWIGPAAILYVISQLMEYASNEYLFNNVDWYIIPVINPDGYEYSYREDRLWRKNRSKGQFCPGVDPNRNFNYHWMEGGASSDECSEVYAGKEPFSEQESRALRDLILRHKDNIKLYITLHSFGKFILYPWNYTPDPPDDDKDLYDLAKNASFAMEAVNGNRYTVGSSNTILYQASGNSEDWVKGIGEVKMSFAIELPGGGETGFDVPEAQIVKIGKETFEGLKVFWEYVETNYANESVNNYS